MAAFSSKKGETQVSKGTKKYFKKKILWFLITLVVAVLLNFFLPRLMRGAGTPMRFDPQIINTVNERYGYSEGPHSDDSQWNAYYEQVGKELGRYKDRSDVSIVNLGNKNISSEAMKTDEGRQAWCDSYDSIEKELGRDGGMFGELWHFIEHIFDGTFGKSTSTTRYPKTVSSIISEGIVWTICLQIPAILLGWILGNVLGAVAAYKRKIWDKGVMPASLFISAIPAFGSAVILLVIFGMNLKWFPANRAYDPGLIPAFTWKFISNVLWHYQLPFWSIVLIAIGGQAVGMRSMSIYELNADYVKYSRFLGIKDRKIVRYVFRNAMLPQVTGLAMSIGTSIGGALVAETIFSYPGLGMKMYNAISENDYNTVSGTALIITIMVLIAAFLLDIIYAFIDPRVKAAQFD
jgi:peptide/nickel transport system permease protein